MNDTDRAEQRRSLEAFANAGAQPNQPSGHALVRPTASLTPIGAQPVAAYRDEAKVLQKLSALAAAAGSDWFYRFPVRTAEGGQDWIEGPSIKLANDIARVFGNCIIEVRELDVGDAFVFYARFSDIETGFSMERAYRQRKGQRTFKSKDADRQLDILYQIGQSKAIRNVICNSLQIYADYAFEQARGSLVEKIGKDLDGWRKRTIDSLVRLPVDLKRVERRIGRTAKDWLASDIAQIVAMGRAVQDGMATIDETFPEDVTIEKAPPSQPSAPAVPHGEAAPASPAAEVQGPAAAAPVTEPPAASNAPFKPSAAAYKQMVDAENADYAAAVSAPKNYAEYVDLVIATCSEATDADQLMKWFRSEPQRRLRNACGLIAEETQQAKALVDARVKELQLQT